MLTFLVYVFLCCGVVWIVCAWYDLERAAAVGPATANHIDSLTLRRDSVGSGFFLNVLLRKLPWHEGDLVDNGARPYLYDGNNLGNVLQR